MNTNHSLPWAMPWFLLTVLGLVGGWGTAEAQTEQRDKLRALRAVYFTEGLALTPAEQTQFLPLLREHEQAISDLQERIRTLESTGAPRQGTEAQVGQWIQKVEALQREEVALRADFLRAALPMLGPQRVARIPELQREFRRRMLSQISERGRPGGPPPPPRRHR